jgi:hypothetical protein
MNLKLHSLYIATVLFVVSIAGAAESQAPRRSLPVMSGRDTVDRLSNVDSARVSARNVVFPDHLVTQDSTQQCRSTKGYVLFGGVIGFIVGSARYEKGQSHGDGDFSLFTRPLVVAPYVLGGMLLGHLIAPC